MKQVSLKRPSKCEELQKLLRERITSGEIQPQSLFPSQNELAAAYQVSHITVREAVGVLVHEGLLTRIQGKGTFVATQLPVKKVSLGLVLSPSADVSYPATAYVIRSITEECNKNNADIRLFIYPDAGISGTKGVLKNLIESGDISGLLLHSLPSPADIEFLNKRSIPFLIISYDAPGKNIASVSVDIAQSVDLAINHLSSLGHRKIALLAGKDRHEILFKIFIDEYKNALQKNSLAYNKDLVSVTSWGVDSGKKEAERILRLPDPPTAVFCAEDLMALGFMRQAIAMGCMVPSDISVVGFSDRFPAEMYPVPLTTIDTFLEKQSDEAINHLLDIVKNNAKPQKLKVAPKLIVRESTAKVKKAINRKENIYNDK